MFRMIYKITQNQSILPSWLSYHVGNDDLCVDNKIIRISQRIKTLFISLPILWYIDIIHQVAGYLTCEIHHAHSMMPMQNG